MKNSHNLWEVWEKRIYSLFHVAIADDLIRKEGDNKTLGLIICKSKNNVLAKYAVGTSNEPIGISEYELSNLLPTPAEIEKKLSGDLEADEESGE